MENLPNHENYINSSIFKIFFVVNVIKPNFHGVEKYVIFLEFHLNPKTNNNNQFLIMIIEEWNSSILHFSKHSLFIE
jgi:hypothetical protein